MMTPAAVELQPCQFCNGTRGRPMLEEIAVDHGGGWRAGCYGCGIFTATPRTKQDAIAAWNTRAALSALAAPAVSEEVEAVCERIVEQWPGRFSDQVVTLLRRLDAERRAVPADDRETARAIIKGIMKDGGEIEDNTRFELVERITDAFAERRAVPDQVAAEREACAKLIERFMTPESGPNYGLMDDPERRDVRQANRTYATLATAIRSRAGGDAQGG